MATKKQTRSNALCNLTNDLFKIRSLIGLCGFAAEARRTLDDIELATKINPDLGPHLDRLVDARNEWREHTDELGTVLKEIGRRLEVVIGVSYGLED